MLDILNDIGVDAVEGIDLMQRLGVSPDHFQDPMTYNRFKDVVKFLSPFKDKSLIISRLTTGKMIDSKLDHLWTYAELNKQKDILDQKLHGLDSELGVAVRFSGEKGISDPQNYEKYHTLLKEKELVASNINTLNAEMAVYEK